MSKVITLNSQTKLNIPADRVLNAAMGELDGAVVMGFDKDDNFYCASSYADGGTVLWLMECLKQQLMNQDCEE